MPLKEQGICFVTFGITMPAASFLRYRESGGIGHDSSSCVDGAVHLPVTHTALVTAALAGCIFNKVRLY